MFKLLKLFFYLVIAAGIIFLYWFVPKYSFIQKNPGFCAQLSKHLYYCGDKSQVDSLFKPSAEAKFPPK